MQRYFFIHLKSTKKKTFKIKKGNLIARYLLKDNTNDISINNHHAENNGV